MVIKSFKESHPSVLMVYFLLIIVLSLLLRNYYLIVLMSTLAIGVDYYYNRNSFSKDIRHGLVVLLAIFLLFPILVKRGNDVIFNFLWIDISGQEIISGLFLAIVWMGLLFWFKVMKHCVKDDHVVYLFGTIFPMFGLIVSIIINIKNKLIIQYQKIKEANYHMPVKNKFVYYRNLVVILITYGFESSLEMMNSMIARGYGKTKRSSFYLYQFKKDDLLKLGITLFLTIISLCGYFMYYQNYSFKQQYSFGWLDLLFLITYLLLGALPIIFGGRKDV